MTPRERVLRALNLELPDKVPWCELSINRNVAKAAFGIDGDISEMEMAHLLGRDNISYWGACPPLFAEREVSSSGRSYDGNGKLKTWEDLTMMDFPNPNDDAFYQPAIDFLRDKSDLAACPIIFLGIDPAWRSMGIESFSYALADDPHLVETVLDRYVEWCSTVAERLCQLDFDFIWAADDIAFGSGPLFSPKTYHELILPRIRKVAEKITLPWIYHSDGNLVPILDDWLSLGMNGMHPIEPESMDIFELKKRIGSRVCLCGNISITNLTLGTPGEVEAEVKEKIERLSVGGGYIISSSNSVPGYAKPENLAMMLRIIREHSY